MSKDLYVLSVVCLGKSNARNSSIHLCSAHQHRHKAAKYLCVIWIRFFSLSPLSRRCQYKRDE